MSNDRKQQLEQLAIGLINAVRANRGSVSKTRLLKLIYLTDVAYYRCTGETFSGFTWIFHHYGPWAREYDTFLEDMQAKGTMSILLWAHTEGEAQLLQTERQDRLQGVLGNLEAEYETLRHIDSFGARPLGELLNYVYFETEPMEGAARGSELDFSRVERSKTMRPYKRTASPKLDTTAIASLRGKLAKRELGSIEGFTTPRFDQEYFEMVRQFEADE